jgi:cell division septum initiation protein DivIVA
MAQGNKEDLATLEMALVGYQVEKEKIETRIRELQSQVKGKPVVAPAKKASGVKRVLSASARRRISKAQKKRWAEHHKRLAQAAKQG